MIRFGRLCSHFDLNFVLLRLPVPNWLTICLWLRSFMVVNVWLDMSHSVMDYVRFGHCLLI